MKTRIIVDSTSDLLPEVRSRVHIVPLSVYFDQEEFIDGVTIDHTAFYNKLVESDVLPTTSQPTPEAFAAEYERARQAGEDAVVITLSSKLSGTFQSATLAAAGYDEVHVVDSGTVAVGCSILIELALQLADAGLTAAQIARELDRVKGKIVIVALLDTLEYLKKGGRISRTVAFTGTLLNIKPVISVSDGEIHMLGKARGSRQGNNLLVQQIEKAGGVDFSKPVLLGYSGLSDALLRKYIEDSRPLWEKGLRTIRYTSIGSVIGTHAGPGAIAAAFFRN